MLAQRLRHKVTIQRRSTSINAYGENESTNWTNFASDVYAGIESFSAREYLTAGATQGERLVKIIIRYMDGINNTMRVLWQAPGGARYYDIKGVLSEGEKNRMITLMCEEGVNDGGR